MKKRETTLQKIVYILKPFCIYMIIKTAAMIGLSMLIPSLPFPHMQQYVEEHSYMLSAVVNSVASIIGVMCLLKDFLTEVDNIGEIEIDTGIGRQLLHCIKKGWENQKGKWVYLSATMSLAITSSVFLNGFFYKLTSTSEKYQNVEKIQYSVPIWLGLLLYGIISPVVEEIVFRGITYHRMRRFFGMSLCVCASALLFGCFHANLPQFLYGTVMGIFMACSYEWIETFFAPLLYHMTANIFVFLMAQSQEMSQAMSQIPFLIVFGVLSVCLGLFLAHRHWKRN